MMDSMGKMFGLSRTDKKKEDDEKKKEQSAEGSDWALLHVDAHDDGGLSCNNEALLRDQRQAISTWLKSIGRRVLTGNLNLINTPMPVHIFEPRSYLEKLADVWVYPKYLSAAADTQQPLERMHLVLTWFLAGLHLAFETWKKPFNPILGETWQAQLSDGTKMYMEQTNHHPPVSCWVMEGPGAKYRFIGLSQPVVSLMLKSYGFQTVAKGYRYIEFADGTRIEVHYPKYVVKGVVVAARPRADLEGEAHLIDRKHKLMAKIRFGPVRGTKSPFLRRSDAVSGSVYPIEDMSAVRSMFPEEACGPEGTEESFVYPENETSEDMALPPGLDLGEGGQPSPNDAKPASSFSSLDSETNRNYSWTNRMNSMFKGRDDLTALGKPLSNFEGSWLSHLSIQGKRVWSLKHDAPDVWVPTDNPLPSDCRYREDLVCLRAGDVEKAQLIKEEMENLQRKDKKTRGF